MTNEELLNLAVKVAEDAHKFQVDKGGNPYINHPRTVADLVEKTEEKIVAYLHDVCEDSEITLKDLQNMGFTFSIVNSVRLLTKSKDISYEDYLTYIRGDSVARAVKIADLKHNMDISRIPEPTEKDYKRIEKYKKALAFLEEGIR